MRSSQNDEKNKNSLRAIIRGLWAPIVIGAFFCFFGFHFGVGIYPDSSTYIEAQIDREPVYPLLLKLMKEVFGQTHFLEGTVAVQNVFFAVSTWYLYRTVTKCFTRRLPTQILCVLVLLVPHVATGIFTPSRIVLSNAILSEGVVYPLYLAFAATLLQALVTPKKVPYLAWSLLWAFVTTLARSQMLPLLLVWLVASATTIIMTKKQVLKQLALVVIAVIVVFLMRSVLMRGYVSANFGKGQVTYVSEMTLLTNAIYSADDEGMEKACKGLNEEEAAELRNAYEILKSKELNAAFAKGNVIDKVLYHEDCHDRIKLEILYEEITQEYAGDMFREVLKANFGKFFGTYLIVATGGLIRSVAVLSPFMAVYALGLYVAAIALMWYLFRREKRAGGDCKQAWFMAFSLLLIAANVFATSLTIMCLSRYMIYNMSLFYLAGILMIECLICEKREIHAEEEN